MGSYVTQTRNIAVPLRSYKYYVSGTTYSGTWGTGSGDNQVTTSYRSGRSEKVGSSRDDPLAFNPSSYKEAFSIYKGEYEEQKRATPVRVPSGYSKDTFVDTGHTFDSTKLVTTLSHGGGSYGHISGSGLWYEGPLVPAALSAFPSGPTDDSGWYGARAIANTAPTNPAANLATFLGELKADRPPHMIGTSLRESTNIFRSLGEEYLNVEFGWKPFISDLKDLLNAVQKAHKLTKQFERDSGRIVRRRTRFPTVSTSSQSSGISGFIAAPPTGPSASWQGGSLSQLFTGGTSRGGSTTVRTTKDVWFSGAFSYYLNMGKSYADSAKRFERKVNHLFGTRLTPDVLWELAPWSWLADWNGNIGNNLTNANLLTSDGLIIRYGYLMTTTVIEVTDTVPSATVRTTGATTGPVSLTRTKIIKSRKRAMPYGFGSNPASYTSRQWSILGALGMTKTPNSLHNPL